MQKTENIPNQPKSNRWLIALGAFFLTGVAVAGLIVTAILLQRNGAGSSLRQGIQWLFASNTTQIWWYVTRSSALVAYFLLWLSTAWGLALPSKINDRLLARGYTYDAHQYISLLAIGFMVVHIVVLLFDHYLPFSSVQLLIPFTSSYRPLWVGIGVISFYLSLLVTVTFYMRRWIGMRTFRVIHVFSLVAYFGATLHGLYAGTDAPLPMVQLLYRGSFLITIFLLTFWLVRLLQNRSGRQGATNQKGSGMLSSKVGKL
jgi:predicted ferric reductase